MAAKHPIQPLEHDARGVLRFKANAIVQHLLDTHPGCDMNAIARKGFSDEDNQQLEMHPDDLQDGARI